MLVASVIGLLWGAMLGPRFSVGLFLFDAIRVVIPIMAALLIGARIKCAGVIRMSWAWGPAALLLAFVWGFAHSPQSLMGDNSVATVRWAAGCGVSNDELIVERGGRVYSARGAAMTDDLVALRPGLAAMNRPVVYVTGPAGRPAQICSLASAVREWVQYKILRFPPDVAAWLGAFVTGEQAFIGKDIARTFKDVGLLHVLVLSGGHLSVVSAVFLMLMRICLLIPFVTRHITMTLWVRVWTVTNLAVMVALFVFCLMVGFSQSIQRAFFGAAVVCLLPTLGLAPSVKSRVLATFFLQAVFFPVNLLSLSMILSWSGSLLLMAFFESTYLKSWFWVLMQTLKIQILFFGMSLLFFGSVGVLSPLANLAGQFVFGALLPINIVAIASPFLWLDALVVVLNRAALSGVNWLALAQRMLPVGFIVIPREFTIDHVVGRCLVVVAMSLFFSFCGRREQKRRPFQGGV